MTANSPHQKAVITFHSTHHALKAEKVLKSVSIKVKVIPVPRTLSSDCGIALTFDPSLENRVRQALTDVGIELAGLYII